MADLKALIARLEAAEGPSRKLDALIERAINPTKPILMDEGGHNRAGTYGVIADFPMDGWSDYALIANAFDAPIYTASIDAALTLVPDGWDWCVVRYAAEVYPGGATLTGPGDGLRQMIPGVAKTSVIALCIAGLKAQDDVKDGGDHG